MPYYWLPTPVLMVIAIAYFGINLFILYLYSEKLTEISDEYRCAWTIVVIFLLGIPFCLARRIPFLEKYISRWLHLSHPYS